MGDRRLGDRLGSPHALAGLPSDAALLLAFSGGIDSRVLLDLLSDLQKKNGFRLVLAHVNHGIRGDEALRDRDFCQKTAAEYGYEIRFLDADVPALAEQHGTGLEEEARRVRYDFFADLMKREGIPILVTAHHADDNLETMLFRLCRGSGLRGLCGIPPVRRFGDGFLVRPMLASGLGREEIERYAAEKNLSYVEDGTNRDTTYARNRIRAEVIPTLSKLFPHPAEQAARTARFLSEDEGYLSSLAGELRASAAVGKGLSVSVLRSAPPPVARRAVCEWLEESVGCSVDSAQQEMLTALVRERHPNAAVAVSEDLRVILCRGVLRCVRLGEKMEFLIPFDEWVIEILPVRTTVGSGSEPEPPDRTAADRILLPRAKGNAATLFWRSRREGDSLFLHGMHKPLRRLFREAGIPLCLRDRLPILCDAEGVVWAPFCGIRDGWRQDPSDSIEKISVTVSILDADREK